VQQVPPDEASALVPDRDAPEQVESGVWRIPLPLPFALRSANAYLIAGGGEWTLVDCGLGTPVDDAALRAGLQAAGSGIEQITTLVLTHAHPDHIGLAGPIHKASGARVRILAGEDERLFRVWGDPEMQALRLSNEMYATHGMPLTDVEQTTKGDRAIRRAIHLPPPDAIAPVLDNDRVYLSGAEFQVIWTPGHSDYHLCLLREDGLFIAGDHVLPRITPNIGVYPNSRPNPLRDYRDSLARVRALPVRLALPGHGQPFADLLSRVDELLTHHEERATKTLALLATHPGGATAYALASDLFGGRLRGPDDYRFALVETLAHLEDLREQGRVERIAHAGHVTYAAVAPVRSDIQR
jgi:glyoxylase-like metal-dependent hydrolase (beta-lactamase superfamily II)